MTKPSGKPKRAKAAASRKPERPRGGDARAIADLLPDIGRAAFRRFGFVQSSVVSRWREIVGDTYADVSVPQSIRFPRGERAGGTLELTVTGAFAPQLQAVTPEIIERVNRFFGYGAVDRLKLVHGSVSPRIAQSGPPAAAAPSLRPVSVELGDSLRAVVDPELSAVLESLAQQVDARADKSREPKQERQATNDPWPRGSSGLPLIK